MAVRLPIQFPSNSVVTAIAGGGGSGGNAGGGGSGSNAGIPIAKISLENCKWQKNLNQLSCPWAGRFPPSITVHSPKSNKQVQYETISLIDPRYDQDQWDGEQQVYKTKAQTNNAEYLVLYHS